MATGKKLSDEVRAAIVKMLPTHQVLEICRDLDVSEPSVYRVADKAGIRTVPKPRVAVTEDMRRIIVSMYKDRHSCLDIAIETCVSQAFVRSVLRKAGVEMRTSAEAQKIVFDDNQLRSGFDEGMDATQMAAELGVGYDVVQKRLNELGLVRDAAARRHKSYGELPEKEILDLYNGMDGPIQGSTQLAKRYNTTVPRILNIVKRQGGVVRETGFPQYPSRGPSRKLHTNRRTGVSIYCDSSWEFHVYKILHALFANDDVLFQGEHGDREHLRAPTFLLDRAFLTRTGKTTMRWHPDFAIPSLKVIIEVKGHPKAVRRWRESTAPAIVNTDMRGWRVFTWELHPAHPDARVTSRGVLRRVLLPVSP